jgi:MinD superfamily P-loop ATPase
MAKELVVLSGKGGTGKTTVAAALAHLAAQEAQLVLADADVDAANLELVVGAKPEARHEFYGGQEAIVDPDLCTACGHCAEVCRFGAIVPGETYAVDDVLCEGCAVCFYQCPDEAIRMEDALDGYWLRSQSRYGAMVHGMLRAGRENSGKLVALVKEKARGLVEETGADLLLVDGPPGIGCAVIASLSGASLALAVTEPTVAGFHDLERIVRVAQHFRVPVLVCLNKADLSPQQAAVVERFCANEGIELLARIPYDPAVTRAMVQGRPITADGHGPAGEALRELWTKLRPHWADR